MNAKLAMQFFAQALPTKFWQVIVASAGFAVTWILPTDALQDSSIGVIALVAFDTLTGIVAAAKEGKAISSKGFGRVLAKLCGYASAVAAVSIATKFLPGLPIAREAAINAVLWTIIATETISVLENAHRINPEIGIPTWITKWLRDRINDSNSQPPPKETA